MEQKKYESLGVDKEKQESEPTLVEKAQKAEAEQREKKVTGIISAKEADEAFGNSVQYQSQFRTAGQDNGRLEETLSNGNYTQDELKDGTTKPSQDKAKADEAKK